MSYILEEFLAGDLLRSVGAQRECAEGPQIVVIVDDDIRRPSFGAKASGACLIEDLGLCRD